ncbi:MAG: hypothetical protein V3T77_01030 [Planctomycetota bacterium]
MRATLLMGVLLASLLPATALEEESLEHSNSLGPVTAKVSLSPPEPVIGDPVTLTLEVVAEKDVELLMPQFGETLERFRILEYAPRERLDDQGRTHALQRYTLQPPFSGEHSIPPILVEFVDHRQGKRRAPEGDDAYELLTPRLDFKVESVIPQGAALDLKPPLGELEPLLPLRALRWPWVLGGVLVLALASPLLVRWWLAQRRLARRKSAYDIATARLEKLLSGGTPSAEQVDAFYVELSSVVRRYLEDRFDLRAPELTTEEFLEVVSDSPDLGHEHQRLLRGFLGGADLVKFAHHIPDAGAMQDSMDAARRFLEETRDNAPLLEERPTKLEKEAAGV